MEINQLVGGLMSLWAAQREVIVLAKVMADKWKDVCLKWPKLDYNKECDS